MKNGHGHEHGRSSTRTDTLTVTVTDAGNDYKQFSKWTQTCTPLWTYTNTDHHQTRTRKQTQTPTLCVMNRNTNTETVLSGENAFLIAIYWLMIVSFDVILQRAGHLCLLYVNSWSMRTCQLFR